MTPPPPTLKRTVLFIAAFEGLTVPMALWAWTAGVRFWSIMPVSLFAGIVGGGFLSAGIYTLKTGYMERGSEFYRFSERPFMFTMDSICIVIAVILALAAPIGFARQQLAKSRTSTEHVGN